VRILGNSLGEGGKKGRRSEVTSLYAGHAKSYKRSKKEKKGPGNSYQVLGGPEWHLPKRIKVKNKAVI